MSSKILVTGAAGGTQGATGNRLTRLLREKGVPVRAFVRKVDERSDVLHEMGAEVFAGDLLDIQSVRQALKGIESVYFCYPVQAGLLEATAILAQAAKEAGVKFIFHISAGASSDQSPSPWGRKNWLSEQILEWSGVPSFHLRPALFFESLLRQSAKAISQDSEIRAPFGSGDGKVPSIAAEDVARLALKVLLNPEPFIGKAYQLFTSNPSLNELAQELTKLLGRPVRYREVTPDQWIKESIDREGSANQEGTDYLSRQWENFLNLNRDREFMARMAKGYGLFKMMTGESPTPLIEWLKLNQTAIEGDGPFQASLKRVNSALIDTIVQ
ncbi:NmrA family NAD(P)-binding protein [Edaphobacter bradus]|uniref:NmrA family NAD(P)-binding protein n=1 Tax=Edaphobacter bradus TaxID=2259016 RepID=UPI0021E0E31D|nr:NmrA family NAD(P)-binding protein [Edaphobacter bradus]